MRVSRAAAIAAAFSLSGCVSYPALYTTPGPTGKDSLGAVLEQARTVRNTYAKGYEDTAVYSDISQVPLIAAAAAVAAILLDKGKHATRRVGMIGIGVGAYSVGRSVFLPTNMAPLYIKGHRALTCVIAEGTLFSGDAADARHETFAQSAVRLRQSLAAARETEAATSSGVTDAKLKAAFDQAGTTLSTAIATANTALDQAGQQENIFAGAAQPFELAVADVQGRVAERGREGRAVDYHAVVDQLTAGSKPPAPKSPPAPPPPPPPPQRDAKGKLVPPTDAEKLERRITAANRLVDGSRDLTTLTPGYRQSIERVTACPAIVAS